MTMTFEYVLFCVEFWFYVGIKCNAIIHEIEYFEQKKINKGFFFF